MPGGSCAPFNTGRTATIEVARCFNLLSINGNSACSLSDSVSDTPVIAASPICGSSVTDPCCSLPDSVLAKNFMSLADDVCKCSFTQGQQQRMWNAINQYLQSLLTSTKCNASTGIENVSLNANNISVFPNPASVSFTIYFSSMQSDLVHIQLFDLFGERLFSETKKSISGSNSILIKTDYLSEGIYFWELTSTHENSYGKVVIKK